MKYVFAASSLLLTSAAWAQSSVGASVQGADNIVEIDQLTALDSRVNIDQIGNSNFTSISQSNANNDADVISDGTNNDLTIEQNGDGVQRIDAQIAGSDHTAAIAQSGIGENEASLIQNGAFNQARIAQNNPGGAVNLLNLLQSGVNNVADLEQDGAGNAIDLSQTGDDNAAAIRQLGDGFAIAISQTGGASVAITQTGP